MRSALETVAEQGDRLKPYVRDVAEPIQSASTAVRDSVGPAHEAAAFAVDLDREADPADLHEQSRPVPSEEEDWRDA